ncbi:alpha/beta hydrolase [bacterium]|nr:alpha/beta hydrolase [bacterium]
MTLAKKILTFFLVFVFILSPLDFQSLVLYSQAQSIEEITEDITWNENKTIENPITISSNAVLTIKKGTTITFKDNTSLKINGKLIAKGMVKNPIKFRGENNNANYSITAFNSGEIIMRSADISGGGVYNSWYLIHNSKNFLKKAYAYQFYQGVITAYNPQKLEMENCSIHDNKAGIQVGGNNIKVNRSKFSNNGHFDVMSESDEYCDFQYNWWGSEDGPEEGRIKGGIDYINDINYVDSIDYSPWAKKENFHDPVIIVPGMMGSWKWTNESEWKLDPIFHKYEKLYDTFDENNYKPGEDLFTFPYNWRGSNIHSAQLLKDKIQEIKQATNWPKVDIVAHSMGGLLTREYIESGDYQNDIDQLITLGTPHNGAPKDYLAWEGGEISYKIFDIWGKFAEKAFQQEAHENGYSSIFDYVRNCSIESIRELLPTYNYLKDKDVEELRIYSENYPTNPFLENLNLQENLAKLNQVEFTNIIGKTDNNESTITQIRLEETPEDLKPMWEHGYPEGYNSIFGDHGLEYGEGDETVPLSSAQNIISDTQIEIDSSHNKLPKKAANIAYQTITGYLPAEEVSVQNVDTVFIVIVFSPVDIQVIDSQGNRSGKDFQTGKILNEIEGAYYTGYETNSEFLTIPNPQDGEYKILTQGTGDGKYKIEAAKIAEDENGKVIESTVSIEGIAVLGEEDELNIEIKDGEVIDKNEDTTPPTITITSPQNKTYLNNQILNVKFTAEDDQTEPEDIQTKAYLDNQILENKTIDLALQNLGEHKIKIIARDEAENKSEETIIFQTDTSLGALIENIKHYHKLKLIKRNKEKRILTKAVKNLKKAEKLIQKIQNSKKISEKRKDKIIKFIQKKTNQYIDRTIKYINRKSDKLIKPRAKELLVESLERVKY